ncbi:MAG: hypothetical protein M0R22_02195 [Dehalococcoidia bacterium]|jgi:hypothetical protein|nr:hypothetical protein [Dehalococcoidia bacterium]
MSDADDLLAQLLASKDRKALAVWAAGFAASATERDWQSRRLLESQGPE